MQMPFPSLVSSLNRLKRHCYSPAPAAVHSLLISPFSFSYLTLFDLLLRKTANILVSALAQSLADENRIQTAILRSKSMESIHVSAALVTVCVWRCCQNWFTRRKLQVFWCKTLNHFPAIFSHVQIEKRYVVKKNRKRHVDYVDKVYMYRARLIG